MRFEVLPNLRQSPEPRELPFKDATENGYY